MTEHTVDRDVRQDVADVLVRYATGIDQRDWALFRSCFTDDCEADYGDIGVWHGVDAITEFMQKSHEACSHTMHRITNLAVTPRDGGVAARSYVDAVIMFGDDQGVHAIGYYDDELVATDDGWKIARRHFTQVRIRMSFDG